MKFEIWGNTGNAGFVEKQCEGYQLHVGFVDNGSIGNAQKESEWLKKHKQNLLAENVREGCHYLLVVIDLIFLIHCSYSGQSTGFPEIRLKNWTIY